MEVYMEREKVGKLVLKMTTDEKKNIDSGCFPDGCNRC